jgi:hypothetical protein
MQAPNAPVQGFVNVRDRVLIHSTLRRSPPDVALDHDVAVDFCHAKASLMRKA